MRSTDSSGYSGNNCRLLFDCCCCCCGAFVGSDDSAGRGFDDNGIAHLQLDGPFLVQLFFDDWDIVLLLLNGGQYLDSFRLLLLSFHNE